MPSLISIIAKHVQKLLEKKLSKTSLWLGQVGSCSSPDNRFTIEFGGSLFEKNNFLPNFSKSLKLTRNLTFISKIYSFNHGKQSPHIWTWCII